MDEETGLYYYGARYYNPRESIFLSFDPMFEQTMTPYQYTYQNPIRYTDPTGMKGEGVENDYKLGSDGTITLDKVTNDESDRLIVENGDVISSNIKKGILSDGINIAKDGLNIQGNHVTNISVGFFLRNLSIYKQKEISWGVYERDGELSRINIQSYENNTDRGAEPNPTSISYKGKSYSLLIGNHTHPSFEGGGGWPSRGNSFGGGDLGHADGKENLIWSRYGVTTYDKNGLIDSKYSPNGWIIIYNDAQAYTKEYVKKVLKWKKKF